MMDGCEEVIDDGDDDEDSKGEDGDEDWRGVRRNSKKSG